MQRKKLEELCQQQDAELCSTEQHRERAAQRVAGIAQHLQGVMLTFPKKTNSLLSEGDAGVLLLGQLWLCSEPGPSAEHRALQVLHSPLDDAVVELEVARY